MSHSGPLFRVRNKFLARRPVVRRTIPATMKKPILPVVVLTVFAITGCAHKRPLSTTTSVRAPTLTERGCHSENGLPDSSSACTPGAVRTTDVDSICHGGSTKQYRPKSSYTNLLKRQQLIAYGYADMDPSHYEEDHLVALEIGGDGKDPKNLWPEPHEGRNNSFYKDRVENWLHRQVCSGAMTPVEAQRGIATDWRQYLPQVSGTKNKKIQ
jgi:hypothetical protein